MSSRLARLMAAGFAALLALVGSVAAATPASAAGGAGYYDGNVAYSTITNCQSIIYPPSYTEYGSGAFVGAYADPETPAPVQNQGFYIRIAVYGLGNACSGQRFVPGFALPANVSFKTDEPILCYTDSGQATGPADCPQWGNVSPGLFGGGTYGYVSSDTANASTWPIPQGRSWEFRFPVRSTTTQSGSTLQGIVRMFDGNSNPTLYPTAPLYVFGGASSIAVLHDAPSTTAATQNPDGSANAFGVLSRGTVYTANTAGTLLLERGTSSNSMAQVAAIPVPAGPGWDVWTDWNDPGVAGLASGNTYYWRLGFDPGSLGGGDAVWGATQSFSYPLMAAPGVTGPGPQGPQVPPPAAPPAAGGGAVTPIVPKVCNGATVTVDLAAGQAPTAGDDVILGTEASDRISAGKGNDTICGSGGNDVIEGGAGNDWIDGGAGTDTLSYASATKKVSVSLAKASAQKTGGAGTDRVRGFENLSGGKGGDSLTGTSKANTIRGGAGNDMIRGGSGDDKLYGEAGNDTLIGGKGKDRGDGGKGKDRGSSIEVKKSL